MRIEHPRSVFRSPTVVPALLALGASLWLIAAPASAQADTTQIVFASGPDESGTVQRLVDGFNAENAGRAPATS